VTDVFTSGVVGGEKKTRKAEGGPECEEVEVYSKE